MVIVLVSFVVLFNVTLAALLGAAVTLLNTTSEVPDIVTEPGRAIVSSKLASLAA
jgi:hypothetical protein